MTKPEMNDLDHGQSDGAVLLRRAVIGIVGGIAVIFLAGVIAGYSVGVFEHRSPDLIDAAVLGALLVALLAIIYAMWRLWPSISAEPVAPSVKSARMILVVTAIVGVPLGVLMGSADHEAYGLFTNAPVSPIVAISSIALWLIAVPVLTWLWWRRVDEHEADAYRDGASIALHAYFFLVPALWMASRAGWIREQHPMFVLLIVSVVWFIVCFRKRYL